MRLTDEQVRILSEAADILADIDYRDVSEWHDGPIYVCDLSDWIIKLIEKKSYQYEFPIGPLTESEAKLRDRLGAITNLLMAESSISLYNNVSDAKRIAGLKTIGYGLSAQQ